MARGFRFGGAGGSGNPQPYYLINDGVLVTTYTTIQGQVNAVYDVPGGQCQFNIDIGNTYVRLQLPNNLTGYSKLVIKKLGYGSQRHVVAFSSNPITLYAGPIVNTTVNNLDTELNIDLDYPYLIFGMASNGYVGSLWLE